MIGYLRIKEKVEIAVSKGRPLVDSEINEIKEESNKYKKLLLQIEEKLRKVEIQAASHLPDMLVK